MVFTLDVDAFTELDSKRKQLQVETQDLQNERNARSKLIGKAKAQGEDIAPLLAEVGSLGEKLDASKVALDKVLSALDLFMLSLPNLPNVTVPEGRDEADNVEVRRWGTPVALDFEAKSHDDLGEALGMMDFKTAAKITGSRFVVMRGAITRLHRALNPVYARSTR